MECAPDGDRNASGSVTTPEPGEVRSSMREAVARLREQLFKAVSYDSPAGPLHVDRDAERGDRAA